jgi:hypothetical protein
MPADALLVIASVLLAHLALRGIDQPASCRGTSHPEVDLADKPAVLRRLQADGFWLIDAVDQPINHLPPGLRRAAITTGVPQLVTRCRALAPRRGVIICHRVVYQLAAPRLRDAACGCCMTSHCRSRWGTGGPSSSPGFARRSRDQAGAS